MKHFLFSVLFCLTSGTCFAETPKELKALVDAQLPGQCTATDAPTRLETRIGILHQVPCADTESGRTDVFVLETTAGLRLLRFPELVFKPATDPFGQPDWDAATLRDVRSRTQLVAARVSPEAGVIRSTRTLRGTQTGQIESLYRFDDMDPTLESVAHVSETSGYSLILPHYPKPDGPPRRVALNLAGFAPQPVSGFEPGTVPDILQQAGLPEFSGNSEQDSTLTLLISPYENALAIDIEETGWADDSVGGRITRLLLTRKAASWHVTDMGTTWICLRGPTRLSIAPCP